MANMGDRRASVECTTHARDAQPLYFSLYESAASESGDRKHYGVEPGMLDDEALQPRNMDCASGI